MTSAPLLHQRYPALAGRLPFARLGTAPTPVRALSGLGEGPAPVWMKDESGYGDGGWGGNKVRKLEWLLPAVRPGQTLLSVGGLGTNWGLAAARYAGERDIPVVLALIDQPVDDHVRDQLVRLRASGARIYLTHSKARTIATVPWLVVRHSHRGRLPYFLPAGGSAPLGVVGYVEVGLEIGAQVAAGLIPPPSHLVTAVGSGGTAAGLLLGLRLAGLRTRVLAVVVNDTLRLDAPALTRLSRRARDLLVDRGAPIADVEPGEELEVTTAWMGAGYGHATPAGVAARQRAAEVGLDLEPVYTAKAMAALLALNAEGHFGAGPVVYLHTDGPR